MQQTNLLRRFERNRMIITVHAKFYKKIEKVSENRILGVKGGIWFVSLLSDNINLIPSFHLFGDENLVLFLYFC